LKTKNIHRPSLSLILPLLAVTLNCVFFIQNAYGEVSFEVNLGRILKEEVYRQIQSIGDEISKYKSKSAKKKLNLIINRYGKHLIREFVIKHGDSNTVLLVDREFILKDGRHQLKYHTTETFLLDIKRNRWDINNFEKEIINYLKEEIEWHYDRGVQYLKKEDPGQAVLTFLRMLNYDPNFALAYCGSGLAYSSWEKPFKAIAEWEKALEIEPELHYAYFAQGVEYFRLKDYQSAIKNLSKATELKKNDEIAFFIRGMANRDLNRIDLSISDFTKVISLNNSNDLAYYARALLKKKVKNIEGAIEDLKEALTLNSQKPEYSKTLSSFEEELLLETNTEISDEIESTETEEPESIFAREFPPLKKEKTESEQRPKEELVEKDNDKKVRKEQTKLKKGKTLPDFNKILDSVEPEYFLYAGIICISSLTFFIIVKSLVFISRTKNENVVVTDNASDIPPELANNGKQEGKEKIKNNTGADEKNDDIPGEEIDIVPESGDNGNQEGRVVVNDVTVSFGNLDILDNISLKFDSKELIGVLGPSGSGKSTLIHSMCGLRHPNRGWVTIDGSNIYENLSKIKSKIGYVPQNDIIHLELSVYKTLMFSSMLRVRRDKIESHRRRVNDVIEMLEINDRSKTKVKKLSGGQRKRVSIGVELLTSPKVLFLDEPTSGLDPYLETKLMQFLRTLADQGRTIFISTHIMENISLLDTLVILYNGKLVYKGVPENALKSFYVNEFKEIYSRLQEHSTDYWQEKFLESAQ